MPRAGYTALIENILAVNGIETVLSTKFSRDEGRDFEHVFYTGPLDGWFGYDLGMLGYRSLEFERLDDDGDFQGNAVINYPDNDVPHTRVTEHKFFAPWETHQRTVVFHERSKRCDRSDEPFYPLRLIDDKQLLAAYVSRAEEETRVTFVGRLATYRYIDMHIAIAEALDVSRRFLSAISGKLPTPRFSVNPAVIGWTRLPTAGRYRAAIRESQLMTLDRAKLDGPRKQRSQQTEAVEPLQTEAQRSSLVSLALNKPVVHKP